MQQEIDVKNNRIALHAEIEPDLDRRIEAAQEATSEQLGIRLKRAAFIRYVFNDWMTRHGF